jgi:NitT/TauT family transport system substrate-binding protein
MAAQASVAASRASFQQRNAGLNGTPRILREVDPWGPGDRRETDPVPGCHPPASFPEPARHQIGAPGHPLHRNRTFRASPARLASRHQVLTALFGAALHESPLIPESWPGLCSLLGTHPRGGIPMPLLRRFTTSLTLALALVTATAGAPVAAETKKFEIAWSIYIGWMPWAYIDDKGILDRWADKYGIEIDLVQINDYIEGINLYTAGRFDGATMANMDMLTIPAAGGVDTTALITGDYSDGNDAVVLKNRDSLEEIGGLDVYLLELSVSHYTLARALESVGMSERDVRVVNTSDSDIVTVFRDESVQAATLWNPQLGEVMKRPEAVKVFDSSQIPGEILDIMAVNTEVLTENPELGKALTGAWFEAMEIISGNDAAAREAKAFMAEAAGTDVESLQAQLDATYLFETPEEKLEYLTSEQLRKSMDFVRRFSFQHGLLGQGARSPDAVGIEMPDGSVLGSPDNVRMRFNHEFVEMAAEGKL